MVTKRKYQYDKPWCIIEHDDCSDYFESTDVNYKGSARCDKCKIAIEKEKEDLGVKHEETQKIR